MCFPKRCRAQACFQEALSEVVLSLLATRCFQEALSEVVLSLVARGAHGSSSGVPRRLRVFIYAQFVVKKSSESAKSRPRFCIARFFFFGEQNWSSPKCPPRFYVPRFILGGVVKGFTEIASAFLFTAISFFVLLQKGSPLKKQSIPASYTRHRLGAVS